jgi:hypothetical protein
MEAARLEGKDPSTVVKQQVQTFTEKEKNEILALFIMALVWSVGVILDEKSRKIF